MSKTTSFITLLSLPFMVVGCLNRPVMPKPVLKTPTQQETTQKTPTPTVSLGTLIAERTPPITQTSSPIIEEVELNEDNNVYSREEEDNEMNYDEEEAYSSGVQEEETPSELVSIKEESNHEYETKIEHGEETSSTKSPITTDNTQSSKAPITVDPYGEVPENYREKIRTYLAKKANPAYSLKYIFSRPQKAYKNDKSWRGWMVQVDVLKRNGKGEILKNQPYTILFNHATILEEIASENPQNITKVVY